MNDERVAIGMMRQSQLGNSRLLPLDLPLFFIFCNYAIALPKLDLSSRTETKMHVLEG